MVRIDRGEGTKFGIAAAIDKYDLSSVERAFSGAAPLDADTAEAASKRIGCRISQGYAADLVLFDSNTIQDHATFVKPHQ